MRGQSEAVFFNDKTLEMEKAVLDNDERGGICERSK